MAGSTLDIEEFLAPDQIGTAIANMYLEWDMLRSAWKTSTLEVQKYVYSTDTTTTTNSKLPWKNKTTLPKICQIRDNLFANYIASLFPKAKIFKWEGANLDEQKKQKAMLLESFSEYLISYAGNKEVLYKLVLDFIDSGNCFGLTEWKDQSVLTETSLSTGYTGAQFVRISPWDIVFNPIATNFYETPKIVRSIMTLGELRKQIESLSFGDNLEELLAAFKYLRDVREHVNQTTGPSTEKNALYAIAGFTSFDIYLRSNYVELLTFYGDYYDVQKDRLYKNAVITVADRHKVLNVRENAPVRIRHVGWRSRPDNLWAMGPLENLVGMQYRIDHIENLKADVFDLIAAPPLMIKGLVEDFDWAPFARIMLGDDGDIKVLAPEGNVLSANLEIDNLQAKMEEYAGSPKEAAGFRTPGEKTAYEVQKLENAANRIFYAKTKQFEEQFFEPLMNDALDLSRRKLNSTVVARVFDDENNATMFLSISQADLAGVGRIKPVAARNYADKAEKVQNLNNFFSSVLGQDPEVKTHFSSIKLARMFEELLDLEQYEIVKPYVRLFENQEAQQLINTGQEQVAMNAMQPAGVAPDDFTQ